jgi:osmotically-inducible protein OsmY
MVTRFDSSGAHDDCCAAGHSASSTKASVSAALAADASFVSEEIEVRVLGPVVVLEGYVAIRSDREKAVRVAEAIVGLGKVQDRMLCRNIVQ